LSKSVFSSKAEKYGRYRWDYAPGAVEFLIEVTGLGQASTAADIGAGTGILTRHLVGRFGLVYAVEPNQEMRLLMEKSLAGLQGCSVVDGCAEKTTLPGTSVDLITAAQAVHWFDPVPTRQEFVRIARPGAWLAILRNNNTDVKVNWAVQAIFTPENGAAAHTAARRSQSEAMSIFYGGKAVERLVFPFAYQQTWEEFIGALISTSNAPDEDNPLYPRFEEAAQAVFDRFSSGGLLEVTGETEMYLEKMI
jgi:ubiquinone/menaquinone biosynthesis C-methylase UbiE